ncbi:hypothetical protein MYU51_005555 [Penicillium brevicompactum]
MTTAMQLRHFNRLQRPETDVGGLPNHWHFEIRPMPGYKGELVFIVNPHGRYFHGEGRTQISNLSIKDQAKVIVPLLLEALSPNSMACPPQWQRTRALSLLIAGAPKIHSLHVSFPPGAAPLASDLNCVLFRFPTPRQFKLLANAGRNGKTTSCMRCRCMIVV